jgi:hypothetical protein
MVRCPRWVRSPLPHNFELPHYRVSSQITVRYRYFSTLSSSDSKKPNCKKKTDGSLIFLEYSSSPVRQPIFHAFSSLNQSSSFLNKLSSWQFWMKYHDGVSRLNYLYSLTYYIFMSGLLYLDEEGHPQSHPLKIIKETQQSIVTVSEKSLCPVQVPQKKVLLTRSNRKVTMKLKVSCKVRCKVNRQLQPHCHCQLELFHQVSYELSSSFFLILYIAL